MSQPNVPKRDPVITLARVLSMIFIILCHIIRYYSFVPGHEALVQFFNCGVYLFIFISGYLYGKKSTPTRFGKWYAGRALTVSLPAVIVSALTIIVILMTGGALRVTTCIAYLTDTEGLLFLNWNFFKIFFDQIDSLGPLWFTTVIMLCYLFTPVLQCIAAKMRRFKLFFALWIICGVILTVVLADVINLSYLFFYSIGYFSGKIKYLDKINVPVAGGATALFVLTLVGRILLHKYFGGSLLYERYVLLSQFVIGSWFVFFFAFLHCRMPALIEKAASLKAVRAADRYSYFVYLVHGIFCLGTFNLYDAFSLPVATVLFILCTAAAAILLKFLSQAVQKPLFARLGKRDL